MHHRVVATESYLLMGSIEGTQYPLLGGVRPPARLGAGGGLAQGVRACLARER